MKYNFNKIEKKWQNRWEDEGCFNASNNYSLPKFYVLVEFPYPSGTGLHVGHARTYTAMDVVARKKRMEGYNVLYPIGWDAFGLPTENFAIANKVHPKDVTLKNVNRFREQLKALGISFDWKREINTTSQAYYKWTQWIFIQMFNSGFAYKAYMDVNWCVSCKCVLANEEVINGACERCSSSVIRKQKSQWMLKITEYAQRLLDDLEQVEYVDRVKAQQRNWIGRSEGAEISFKTSNGADIIVYTTRPDTIFGATYMVISPEHPYISQSEHIISNIQEVYDYRDSAKSKSEFERTELAKDKTGVCLNGVCAINPLNGKEIPIFVSDYVLMTYGTGAIMSVPAHDSRDWDFAKKFNLPIISVLEGGNIEDGPFVDTIDAKIINSDFIDGMTSAQAKSKIIDWVIEHGVGKSKVNYKLRDWIFSRQRYWGEPIPLVNCKGCGWVPINESDLPLTLPEVENYEQTDNGESPLIKMEDWVNTTCPKCGGPAVRETDTMPQWAGSSWYYLRYCDVLNDGALASKEALDYWLPVDWYNGGMEHTTLHLLYSRFWHKFLYDSGIVSNMEPYKKRTSHGMILGENGEKMAKSRGNSINPDDIIAEYGADSMRLYEMFLGDFEKAASWSSTAIRGCQRFLDKVWNLSERVIDGDAYSKQSEIEINKAIKKVTDDIDSLKFNTAIATMMALVNHFNDVGINRAEFKTLLILLNPFAPHITEELWQMLAYSDKILSTSTWVGYDETKIRESVIEIAVQINGKLKSTISVPNDCDDELALKTALDNDIIKDLTSGKSIAKTIVVRNKIVNLVVH